MENRHLPVKSPPRALIADGDPVGVLRHFREDAGPALVCVGKAVADPSVSAIRMGGGEGPINRRGAARAAPVPMASGNHG